MTTDQILQNLKDGNARYIADQRENKNQDGARRDSLTTGQAPHTIVLSCADSRVVPELIFDQGIGELFVLRVAGNVANTSTIASIEYAVAHLGTSLIVVLGHESCGAVGAALGGGDNGYNLNHLLSHINPAIAKCGEGAGVNDVVKENARLNGEELAGRSNIIGGAVKEGKVKIVSAFYNLNGGKVDFLD